MIIGWLFNETFIEQQHFKVCICMVHVCEERNVFVGILEIPCYSISV